mgnify:CR=1 FL=1
MDEHKEIHRLQLEINTELLNVIKEIQKEMTKLVCKSEKK